MPVYNGANTIRLALKSLIAQTYTNWECVIVNDGSTDGTKEILDSLTDPRFKVIHLAKNGGRGAARQVCLDNADGDYLTYLDADDFYHPDKIRFEVDILNSDNYVYFASCGVLTFDDNYKPIAFKGGNHKIINFKDGDFIPAVPVTVMIRLKEALQFQYNPRLNAGEDIDYFSRYNDGRNIITTDRVLYYYSEASSTYKKFMQYSFETLKQAIVLMNRKPYAGTKLLAKNIIRYIIVFIATPFLGVDFFIKRRGKDANNEQIDEYYSILDRYK